MAADTPVSAGPADTWFSKTAAYYRAISAASPELTSTKLLLTAGTETGKAYDFIFSPGGMVSNILVGDLKENMGGVVKFDDDMKGTIEFFEDMCKKEVEMKGLPKVRGTKASGTVSGLWFLRHLLFVRRFIELLFENELYTPSEAASRTYAEVLKPYHGFLLGGVVSAAMALAPTKDTFCANLGAPWDVLKVEMAVFLRDSGPVLDRVKGFYDAQGWYFPDKV